MKQLRGLTRLYRFWDWIEQEVGYIDGKLARDASLALPEGTLKEHVGAWCKQANSRFSADAVEDGRRLKPVKAALGNEQAELFDAHGIQLCIGDVVEITCSLGAGSSITEQVRLTDELLPRPFLSVWNGHANVICLMSVVATSGKHTALMADWLAPDKTKSARAVLVKEAQAELG